MKSKHQFFIHTNRIPFIQNLLGNKVSVIKEEPTEFSGTSLIEVTIESDTDVLQIFHAGVHYGLAVMKGEVLP